ncbi:MAG: hypothetical protein Kow0099_04540 [Candidatus Abyssubacteria bacterium]
MTKKPLEEKKTLLSMARVFRTDIQDIQQRGAGYYSCGPFVNRYNKLLAKARELFSPDENVILQSFDPVEDTRSVDPADKMKVTQSVLIELGQLIAFMESVIGQEEQTLRRQAPASSQATPTAQERGED